MLAWLLENSARLNFTVYRDREIRKYLPHFHDYIVTVQLEDKTIWGRGIDSNETTSLTAACSEVVERATLQYQKTLGHKWTSNGIAAHVSFENAKECAIAELIERDAFLTHYLTNSPFFPIEIPPSLLEPKEALEQYGTRLCLRTLQSPKGWHTTMAACFGENAPKPFGLFVGAATSRNRAASQIKALKEVVAFVSGFLRDSNKSEVQEAENNPLYHYRFSSKQQNAMKIEHFFSAPPINANHFDLNMVEVQILDLHPAFEGCPVTVVRATSPDAQQLFFGETKPEHINFKRLSQFLGKEVRWEDVNKTTHVFA